MVRPVEPRAQQGSGGPPPDVGIAVRIAVAVVSTGASAVLYMVPNHYAPGPAVLLPWTALDEAVPFVPETVWVYLSDYALVASAFFLMRGRTEVRRFAVAYYVLLGAGFMVHWLWPTVLPRDRWPLQGDGLTVAAFSLLRSVDQPLSCLPSMHVAGSYLAAFSLWRHSRAQLGTWVAWATAVAASTLTAKQHYAVDVLAGLALAALVWLVCFYWPELRARRAVSPSG